MSYRELRNFTEHLRALGYQRPVSVENFRVPNFDLVADILRWILKRYDHTADIPESTASEHDRVHLLTAAAKVMQSKGRIKLNPKRLYMADGYAVKELIKITSVLYDAMRQGEDEDETLVGAGTIETASLSSGDLKAVRDLASDITQRGASLFDLLGREEDLRAARQRALAHNPDMHVVEETIQQSIRTLGDEVKSMEAHINQLQGDQRTLDSKIERKRMELERQEKRFKSLQSVRPAYMDEYERLEVEMQQLFRIYLERFRNIDYIQSNFDDYNRKEQERMDENESRMKEMIRKLREEELAMMRGEQEIGNSGHDDGLFDIDEDTDDSMRSGGLGNSMDGSEGDTTDESSDDGSIDPDGIMDDDASSSDDDDAF